MHYTNCCSALIKIEKKDNMEKVTKEKFYEVLSKTPYRTSFVLGSKGMRYNGTKGLFKDSMFAKEVDGEYFLNKAFL